MMNVNFLLGAFAKKNKVTLKGLKMDPIADPWDKNGIFIYI